MYMKLKKVSAILLIVFLLVSSITTYVNAATTQTDENEEKLTRALSYHIYDYYTGNSFSPCFDRTFSSLNGVQFDVQLWVSGGYNVRVLLTNQLGNTILDATANKGGSVNTFAIYADSNSALADATSVRVRFYIKSVLNQTVFLDGVINY